MRTRRARAVRAALAVGLGLGLVGHALAQQPPHRQQQPLPQPAPLSPDAASNTLDGVDSSAPPPVPGAGAAPAGSSLGLRPPVAPPPPPPVLRSAVHSRYSLPATITSTTTGQCRARCAESRTECDSGQGDVSGCDPGWTQCLSACDGLTYSRGP